MKYILQVNTGNTETKNYDSDFIIEKLEHIGKRIDISRVIFGWNSDPHENQKISEYLHSRGIEAYFWLPVFAEIIDLDKEDRYVENGFFEKKTTKLSEGDAFEFVCQSSERNTEYIIDEFEKMAKGLKLDGVFLDRIRYKSPALSKDAIYGCLCDRCRELYKDIEIDKDIYDKLLPERIANGTYEYGDENLNALMSIKRDTISRQVGKLHDYFSKHNLKVGLDTFALCVADFVGQDIFALEECSDFIKPMFYLRTTAPAGLPFELEGLPKKTIEVISGLWGSDLASIEGSVAQCDYLIRNNIHIAPGIDVNRIEGICDSDEGYVAEYMRELKNVGCKEIVLSWDSMKIEDSLLKKITEIE